MVNHEAKLTQKLYSRDPEREWRRLERDEFHQMEFDTTMRFLKKHLPRRGRILDAGGGPGRYTIALARLGYKVTLLDLVRANLDLAKTKIVQAGVGRNVEDVTQGSVTDLSRYTANSFDAVVCLGGPLSHVHPEKDRKIAIRQLLRVAKKGAPVCVSVIGLLAVIGLGIVDWPEEYQNSAAFNKLWRKGDDYNFVGGHFAHFFTLSDLEGLFPKSTRIVERVGLEGLASMAYGRFNVTARKYPRAYRNFLEAHETLCTHPSVVDTSGHFMVVAKK